MLLQLDPTILVDTTLGRGQALFLIDYGMHQNTCWVVALQDNGGASISTATTSFSPPIIPTG